MNDCKQNCDLHMGCTTPKISAVGNYSAPLIIVLDSPTRKDDEGGSLCSGKMGEYLFKLLGEYRSNIYITSIVKCCPYQNITDPAEGVRIPYIEEINQCLPNFYEELSHFDPNKTVIMLMGDAPMEAILGKKTLEKKDVGDLQYAEIDGVNWKVMPNYSPAFILRGNLGSSIESTFKSTLEVAINLYRQETEEEKVYTIATPSEAVKETKLIIEAYQDKDIKHVLFDCETTGLVPWRDKVFMYSFYAEGVTKKSVAAPLLVSNVIHHEKYPYPVYPGDFEVSPRDRIMVSNAIGDMIRAVPITGHNLKYDISMIVLAERIVKLEEVKLYYDTLLMSHILIGRDQFGALDLKTLCSELFGVPSWDAPIDSYLSMFRLTEDRTYDKIPTSIVGKYAAEDTYYNSKLFDLLESRITDENRNIINIIHGIQPVFTEAEIKGICFDTDIFGYIRDSYKDILSGHRKELMGLCDPWVQPRLTEALEVNARKRKPKSQEEVEKAVFNMSSPKQKADILYGYFGMPLIETRKKGKKSSTGGGDKETIAKLLKHPDVSEEGRQFLGTLTKYTALNKLITSYIDNAESMISDGNIYHPSYNINGAVTGRHSSGYHTLPKKSDIKRLYTTRWKNQGGLIACFDYSQLELRVIASLANESAWIEAFEQGVDVHQATAAKAFNVPVEKVTSDQRKAAKSVNFGLVYGISDAGLAENIGVSIDEAARLKKAVFAGCTGLNDWFAERHSYVDAHKSITTVFGRTIPIDMQTLWKQEDKEANHRRAVNYSVQSPGSDLVTDSIVRIYRNMKKRGMKTILIGSVHDSILFDIYPGELPMVVKLVKHACEVENMRMYSWIKCPIVVDATIGLSWGGGIDFKVSYEDGGMCFKGEGLRKDILSIIRSGEGVYDWTYEVLKVEEVKEQPKDKVIRDRYTWEAVLKLGI